MATVSNPAKRRWRQFGLRAALAAILLFSFPLAWLAKEIARVRKQSSAMTVLESRGGHCYVEFKVARKPRRPKPLTFGERVSRAMIGKDAFRYVDNVQLGAEQNDDDLVLVGQMERLNWLDISNTQVTNDGLAHLSGLSHLRELFLHKTQISDAGLAHLSGLDLIALSLNDTQVSDAGLQHLESQANLLDLWIGDTNVTEAGVARLRKALPNCNIRN